MEMEMEMKMAALDENVVTEILSYLPLKDATRFQAVCRAWHLLISGSYFRSLRTQRQACNVSGFFHPFFDPDSWPQLHLRLAPHNDDRKEEPIKLGLEGRYGSCVLCVCDGLLYVSVPGRRRYLWNLSNSSFARIPVRPWRRERVPPGWSLEHMAFGLAKGGGGSCPNSYQIACMDVHKDIRDLHQLGVVSIYSSRTGKWRRARKIVRLNEQMRVCSYLNPVGPASARRSLYWLTNGGMILAFDFTGGGRFRKMSLPVEIDTGLSSSLCKQMIDLPVLPKANFSWDLYYRVWLGSVGGDLYLLFVSGSAVELWVLEGLDRWKRVLEVEYAGVSTPVFFDGRRIALADPECMDAAERRLRFYDTFTGSWDGDRLLPALFDKTNLRRSWFLPLIKDTTLLSSSSSSEEEEILYLSI